MRILKTLSLLPFAALLACETSVPTQPDNKTARLDGITVHQSFICELEPEWVSGGGEKPTIVPDATKFSPFVLTRMSLPDEPNRFGHGSRAGNTVGAGEQQPDGRWVVSNWVPQNQNGPFFTLMTLFPDGAVLLSHLSGPRSHLTFAGQCVEQ